MIPRADDRVLRQIDALTERETRRQQDARWGAPDLYRCENANCAHVSTVPERCPACGGHRE